MFFKRSHPVYTPADAGPNILALASDYELSEIRIRPFLSALLARDVIASFQFVDRKMRLMGWSKEARFSHIWCHRNISSAQQRFLERHAHVPIIYDLDDLLTDVPEFVMKKRAGVVKRIEWCLAHADLVTTSTEQLKKNLLNKVDGTDVVVLKNGHAGCPVPRLPVLKKQIIWTSGDVPFILNDDPDFMENLAKLTNRHGYEMILIGRFEPEFESMFDRCRHIQRLDFYSYREFLRFCAGSLGFAPLPSGLPASAQQYFDAKSDIKLVDYLSAGLVPVCSSTAPYSDSDLFIPLLAASDTRGLLEKLDMCIDKHSSMISYVDEAIHARGLLKQREFFDLSKSLDFFFKSESC